MYYKTSAFSKLNLFVRENLQELALYLNSISFSRAIRVAVAVTIPLIIGRHFGQFEIGLVISYGAFWSSPSDVIGSFRHKKISILIATLLAMLVSFIKGYLNFNLWLLLPVLGLLTFAIAFISVYGFRASLVSFSGLMALTLSSAKSSETIEIYQYALLIGLGGLWYLLLSKIWFRINPKAETEEFLSDTYTLTAQFIETRGKLISPHQDRQELQSKLQNLQGKLTENHGTLREILILSKKTSGLSNYNDKRLLVFVQLVDMLETAIANPGNYDRMKVLFTNHPQYITCFQDLIFEMAYQLQMISKAGNNKENLPKNDTMKQYLDNTRLEIALLQDSLNFEEYIMLQNLLEYQEKQYEKIKKIKWLLGDQTIADIELVDQHASKSFVAFQDYNPRLLIRNFSFESVIFRHSFRLAVTIMIGYALGSIFAFQNPYSILLIIIVIMRPSYGLTKNRAKDRIIGTFIGGAMALLIVFLIQNSYVYGIIGISSLVVALSLVQKNYKASATFITLSVVLIYAILNPDVLSLMKFRILDTLVGAGLSYAAMLWLWPTWEFVEIKDNIEKSIKANKDFLNEISKYYKEKGNLPTSYSLARKQAFLETSNLNSAFQRMTQDPKSKQKQSDKIYELVVLNHSFLASLASISTYIQNNKTSQASQQFEIATAKTKRNLERVLVCLKDQKCDDSKTSSENYLRFEEQLPAFNSLEINNSLASNNKETERNLQEAHLVWEQLQWMFSISCKMLKLAASMKLD